MVPKIAAKTPTKAIVATINVVLDILGSLDSSRKCYRLVGGVLVERTVGEVVPAVQRNRDGIQDILKKMNDDLNQQEKDLSDFAQQHKILGSK